METISAADIELLVFGEDCACESVHQETICSGVVSHRKYASCEGRHILICQNSANYNLSAIAEGHWTCAGCGVLITNCWTITPI